MTLKTIVANPFVSLQFDTIGRPIELTTTASTAVNWNITGYGNAIGDPSRNHLYDQTILPVNGTATVTPATPLLFPFVGDLYSGIFDAIVLITANGVRAPQGFSSSDENAAPGGITIEDRPIPIDRNVFWTDLYCFYGTGAYGSAYATSPYMFGGDANSYLNVIPLNIYFSEVLSQPLTVNFTISSYDLIGTVASLVGTTSGSIVLAAGARDYQILADCNLQAIDARAFRGYDGYFKIELTTGNSSFESLLSCYHWGVEGAGGGGYGTS